MDILKLIADNEVLYDTLAKLLYEHTEAKPDLSLDDKALGERVRGQEVARKAIDNSLQQILRYKTKNPADAPRNPAR